MAVFPARVLNQHSVSIFSRALQSGDVLASVDFSQSAEGCRGNPWRGEEAPKPLEVRVLLLFWSTYNPARPNEFFPAHPYWPEAALEPWALPQ